MRTALEPTPVQYISAHQLGQNLGGIPAQVIERLTWPSYTPDPLPYIKIARRRMFAWGSPELVDWIERRKTINEYKPRRKKR